MRSLAVSLFFIGLIIIIGCSGGGNPITQNPISEPMNESALSGMNSSNLYSSHMNWGLWQFTADPDAGTLDIVPLRTPNMHLNALPFLEPPALVNLTLESLKFNADIIEADIGLRHPFLGLDEFTGFDVCGVFIASGSKTGFSDAALRMAADGDTRLLNPDGYTRWWNPVEFPHGTTIFDYKDGLLGTPDSIADFNCTLNPYKFFCDALDDPHEAVSNVPVESRCVFSAGKKNIRHYTIKMSGGLIFNYAVDACWQFPTGPKPWTVPDDFAPEANRPEAWNIQITETKNTLWNDGSGSGGQLGLNIDVWDHYNAGMNLVHAESPGNFTPVGPIAPLGGGIGFSTYQVDIASATPAVGSIDILIIAESDVADYGGMLPGKTVSAYFVYTAKVGEGGDIPPVAVAEIVTAKPWCPGDSIKFDASASYDPDGGPIVGYAWDFNGDGVYGDAYDSGTDDQPVKKYANLGVFNVDVRVTDDDSDTDTLDDPLVLAIGSATWVDDDAVAPYDGTFEHPWPTIQQGITNANNDCPGGKWVLVKDGTYTENITLVNNITVEGYSAPAPLIVSPDGSTSTLVNISSYNNVTLKHFRVQPRTTNYGIYASGTNVKIDDIEFLNNPGGNTCSCGVYVSGSALTGNVVNNIRVNGYQKAGSGFINVSGRDVKVTNCVLLNITFTAASSANVLYVNSNYSSTNCPDVLVAKNVIGHVTFSSAFVSTQWVTIFAVDYCRGATVRNNLIFDIKNNLGDTGWTWGMDIYRAKDMILEHNTISGVNGPAWIYAFETADSGQDPSGVIHRDHIVANLTTNGTMNWRWAFLGSWGAELPVNYSCAYSVGNPFYYPTYQVKEGVGCTFQNPQFLNPSIGDYRVAATSPCHNKAHDGTDMGAYGGTDPLTWLP